MTIMSLLDEISAFFEELESVQEETIIMLRRKQTMLASADVAGIQAIAEEEKHSAGRLETCLQRRESLLAAGAECGFPAESIEQLCKRLPNGASLKLRIQQSQYRTRLIQFQALTNWVLAQRSVLHLNQLLELIALKGGVAPTYGRDRKKETGTGGGHLVDRVA